MVKRVFGSSHRPALSLGDAARWARAHQGPIRAWREHEGALAEVYFLGEVVVHTCFGEQTGEAAVRAMLDAGPVGFWLELGRWPERHTLLVPWGSLRRQVERAPKPPSTPEAVRYRDDDDATARIGPDEVHWRRGS